MGVYLFSFTSATILHFFLGVFLHFSTGVDTLELYQQANARLRRQGQMDTVVIHHIITSDTIDERIMSALSKKEKTQSALIDAVKANLEVSK